MKSAWELDLAILRTIHVDWHCPPLDLLFTIFSFLGLGGVQAALCFGFLFIPKMRHFTTVCIYAIIISGLPVAQLMKKLIPRDRPSNLAWTTPQEEWLANSFPSGHTSTSFAVATMICILRGKEASWLERIAWFSFAILVAISRVYRAVHWPSDVLAGAFAGIFSACLLALIGMQRPDHPIHGTLTRWFQNLNQKSRRI